MILFFPLQGQRIVQRQLVSVLSSMVLLMGPACLAAQARPPQTPTDSLRLEIQRLGVELDSIRALLARGQAKPVEEGDALARLRAAAARAAGNTAADVPAENEDQAFVSRGRSLQALNPEISVSGNLYGVVETGATNENNFVPRQFEIALQSSLDPFSRAKIFLTTEQEGGGVEVFTSDDEGDEEGRFGLGIDEAYIEWLNLASGLSLKVGRFFQQLGQLNRFHAHALPFQGRSLPHLVFVGEEPLTQDGVSLRWLLPVSPLGGAYEISLEGTRSRNEALFGKSTRRSGLAHINVFWQTSEATDFEVGFSGLIGSNVRQDDQAGEVVFRNRLFAVESAFNWAPPSQSRYRGVTVRAGAMLLDPQSKDGVLVPNQSWGVWALAETKLNGQWIAGGRYGWVENPNAIGEKAWLATPQLTYWQSEYVRLRAAYDLISSAGDTSGILTLRITFAMGPHKHETY